MKDIEKIDPNFKVKSQIDKKDVKFYSALDEPFRLYGLFWDKGTFRRLPEETAKRINEGVYSLHTNTAGGRIRFKTNSPYIALYAVFESVGKMPHFAMTGSSGFDLYEKKENQEYAGTFVPPFNFDKYLIDVIDFSQSGFHDLTLNFPLYSSVSELYIGVSEASVIEKSDDYKTETPIVYYGSSITQGGCASRPGNSYQNIISREFDCDYINLGFSGSARGEDAMAQYIKGLDMKLFVYDYDYNAPDVEHLRRTHEKMFKIIRESNPDLPVIMMSKPIYEVQGEDLKCREVINRTFINAVNSGDNNVYFIDGKELMALCKNDGTVDNCHPNDWGFYSMAHAISKVLKKIL